MAAAQATDSVGERSKPTTRVKRPCCGFLHSHSERDCRRRACRCACWKWPALRVVTISPNSPNFSSSSASARDKAFTSAGSDPTCDPKHSSARRSAAWPTSEAREARSGSKENSPSNKSDGRRPTRDLREPREKARVLSWKKLFPNDEEALGALASGEIDALDRAPPWQLDRLKKMDGVSTGRYALPTVHALLVNWGRPILELREFRRALCFAIDRPAIVQQVILGGNSRSGYRPLSGPFPAGTGVTDPIAYAYKPELAVRPYEPTLARALAAMAEGALAKKAAAVKEAEAEKRRKDEPATDEGDQEEQEAADHQPPPPALSQALVLLHSTDPVARLACQSIKLYLDQAGIPITLRELAPGEPLETTPHDLRYVELCVWEPLVDARRLLGPGGIAGRSSAYMNLALNRLERAANWNEATSRLHEIHEIAHYDLPLIPLWQTENYFAHRNALQNVGSEPVTLYQNVTQWEKEYQQQGARP